MAVGGKNGSVAVGGVDYPFGKWSDEMDGDDPEVTNFSSGGCYEDVEGIHRSTITLEGPYAPGSMPLVRGTVYTFTLRVSNSVTFTASARVKSIGPSQDVKDAARLRVVCRRTGAFTPAIT